MSAADPTQFRGYAYVSGFQASAINEALYHLERGRIGEAQLALNRSKELAEQQYAVADTSLRERLARDPWMQPMPTVTPPVAP